jgi:hypothetical protein
VNALNASPARFGVVSCSGCRAPWAVELRNAAATCPACRTGNELAGRRLLWAGDDAREAQAATAALRQGARPGPAFPAGTPRHDSPVDAAAAKGRGIVNKSARAEEIARWLERLVGAMPHRSLSDALVRSGMDQDRAEAEITRMLAVDVLLEPRAGHYRTVGAA